MKTKLFLITLSLLVAFSVTYAAKPFEKKITKVVVKNLITCLTSENEGVRKDAVKFAGSYQISETLIPLMKILRTDKNEEVRLLAAESLYMLENDRGIYVVKSASYEDDVEKVRTKCNHLYLNYQNGKPATDLFFDIYSSNLF